MGMSSSGMVSSFGVDAFGINPANFYTNNNFTLDTSQFKLYYGKKRKPIWSISLFSAGGAYGCDSNIDFYDKYINYLSINRETFTKLFTDINSVLQFRDSILPNNKTDVNYDLELKWLSVNLTFPKFGAVNFTVADRIGLNTDANSRNEYLPLNFSIIFHNLPNPYPYDLVNTELHQSEATAWWIRKFTLGFSKLFEFKKGFIKNLTIGITGGLVQGFGNIITYNSDLYISTYGINRVNNITHIDSLKGRQNFNSKAALTDFFMDYKDGAKSHFNFFPKPAGIGFNIDIGINMQIGENVCIAASIADIGRIKWNYHTFINYDYQDLYYSNFNMATSDPTYNRLVNDLDGLDSRDTVSPYTTPLPLKFRAGILYKTSNKLLFELNWVKGDNDLPGNSSRHNISIGSEYVPIPFLPLRGGISFGGPEEFRFSLGSGLRFRHFTFDIAVSGINNLIAHRRLGLALSTKIII